MTDPYPDFRNKTLSEIKENRDWEIIAEARGSLDQDGKEDFVIILESKDSLMEKRCDDCALQDQKARIIVVLLTKNSQGVVMVQNNVFIARAGEGGITKEIKPELSIATKQLKLAYVFLRGETNYIFEVMGDDIVLVEAFNLHASHYLFNSEAADFKKGILVTESRAEKDQPVKTKTIKIDKKLQKLSELKMMGTLKVADGVFF